LNVEDLLEEKALLIDNAIEKYIPRVLKKDAIVFKLIPPHYAYNLETLNKTIAQPIWEFLDRGGKRWRPTLFLLISEALGKDSNELLDYAIIPEVVHNGTLMVDDIEDESDVRRGKPCTYKIFGVDIAINAGNAMYYLPLLPLMENRDKISAEQLQRIFEIYAEEMINLSLGQAMDIGWHRGLANADSLSEEDYLQMCAYKTGTLARMSARMSAVLCGVEKGLVDKFGRFAESIGVAFQMRDDVLDLSGESFGEKKGGRGNDITEGKRSLIVIHTLKAAGTEDRKRLIEILNMRTSDQNLKDEAIRIMQKYNSLEYVKKCADNLVAESWSAVERLLPDSNAKEKLKAFAEFLVKRKT
jgi:geranylgeranyl diphosphate synthase type I